MKLLFVILLIALGQTVIQQCSIDSSFFNWHRPVSAFMLVLACIVYKGKI